MAKTRELVGEDLAVEALTPADWQRIAELVDTYADLGLGGVDAGVVALAERLGVTEVATLDLRHSESCVPDTSTPSRCCPDVGRMCGRRDLSVT